MSLGDLRSFLASIDGIPGNDSAHGGLDPDICFVDEGDIVTSCEIGSL